MNRNENITLKAGTLAACVLSIVLLASSAVRADVPTEVEFAEQVAKALKPSKTLKATLTADVKDRKQLCLRDASSEECVMATERVKNTFTKYLQALWEGYSKAEKAFNNLPASRKTAQAGEAAREKLGEVLGQMDSELSMMARYFGTPNAKADSISAQNWQRIHDHMRQINQEIAKRKRELTTGVNWGSMGRFFSEMSKAAHGMLELQLYREKSDAQRAALERMCRMLASKGCKGGTASIAKDTLDGFRASALGIYDLLYGPVTRQNHEKLIEPVKGDDNLDYQILAPL